VPWHIHPGVESSFIMEGESTLLVKGEPERVVKPGDGFQIPARVPHSVQNGDAPTSLIITYVVEKDKPLASPA
ncbi:MAG TPA: cupin domain-containing protein, partial [Acetobacteraceae bacterium]|nr:cupin domain-containing protein [Acetobacteraceae bacterium]